MFGSEFSIRGCYFHWTQAVQRHLQLEGLTTAETTAEQRYVCRLLLALPLLPAERIKPTFDEIHRQATGKVLALCNYINRQVIERKGLCC